ncbi:hypothetical protein BDP67DRAFT_115361 [Colletotrichum lupini]|nr:hypothetical protein BDP67DRAFT_115361 [Colletotrichum lupini]
MQAHGNSCKIPRIRSTIDGAISEVQYHGDNVAYVIAMNMRGRSHRSTCNPPSLLHCCLSPYGKLIRDEQLPFSANLVPIHFIFSDLSPIDLRLPLCPPPTTARNPASQRQDRTWGPSSDVRSQANCITRPSLLPLVPGVDKGIPRQTTSPTRAVRRRRPRLVRTHPSTHIQYPQASRAARCQIQAGRVQTATCAGAEGSR